MTLKKDFKNFTTTLGVIAVVLSIGGVIYTSQQEVVTVDNFANQIESEVVVADSLLEKPVEEEIPVPEILIETTSTHSQNVPIAKSVPVPVEVPVPVQVPVRKPTPVVAPPVIVPVKVISPVKVSSTPQVVTPPTTTPTVVKAKTTTVKKTRTSRAS